MSDCKARIIFKASDVQYACGFPQLCFPESISLHFVPVRMAVGQQGNIHFNDDIAHIITFRASKVPVDKFVIRNSFQSQAANILAVYLLSRQSPIPAKRNLGKTNLLSLQPCDRDFSYQVGRNVAVSDWAPRSNSLGRRISAFSRRSPSQVDGNYEVGNSCLQATVG